MPFAISAQIDVRDAMARLAGLKQGKRNKILRTATTKASRLVLKTAKGFLRDRRKEQKKENVERNGLLRKSLGVKIKTYDSGVVVGMIGPRHGFKEQVGTRTRDGAKGKAGEPIYEDPAKIAHLVEYGHGGPHPAPPHPFMRPAWEQSRDAIQQIFRDEIDIGLRKLAQSGAL